MGGNVFAFCRITSFYIFTVFLRTIYSSNGEGYSWTCSFITVADQVDVSHIKTVWDVAAYAGTQIVIGLSLSKIVEMLWNIPKMAGHILDFDIGLSQASLFDVNADHSLLYYQPFLIYFSHYFYFTWRH